MDLTYYKKPAAFVAANPDCTFEEFQKATGSSRQVWYDSRHRAKVTNSHITKRPLKPSTKYILAHPNATYDEFKALFGDDKKEYGQARHRAKAYMELRGLKDLIVPFRRRTKAKKTMEAAPKVEPTAKPESSQAAFTQPTPQSAQAAHLESSYERDGVKRMEGTVSLGTTPEFIWYEATIIRNDFARTMNRFDHLVRVMESRQADNNKALEQAVREIGNLRRENKSLTELLDSRTQPGK